MTMKIFFVRNSYDAISIFGVEETSLQLVYLADEVSTFLRNNDKYQPSSMLSYTRKHKLSKIKLARQFLEHTIYLKVKVKLSPRLTN
jgi:hypothetical protein